MELANELEVGVQSLVDTLKKQGVSIEEKGPNTRISRGEYDTLIRTYMRNKPQEEIKKIEQKFWGERTPHSDRAPKANPTPSGRASEGSSSDERSKGHAPKVLGKLDLDALNGKKKPKDQREKEVKAKRPEVVETKVTTEKVEQPQDKKDTGVPLEKASTEPAKATPPAATTVTLQPTTPAPKKEEVKPTPEKAEEPKKSNEAPSSLNELKEKIGFKVVGKIDLDKINDNSRPSKKSRSEKNKEGKRKRIKGAAVDVNAEAAKVDQGKKKGNANSGSGGNNADRRANDKNNRSQNNTPNNPKASKKAKQNTAKAQITEEDVQKQVKETLARLTGKKNNQGKGAKYRKDKRQAARDAAQQALSESERESKTLKLTEFVTVSDLANLMDVPVNQVIATCMSLGLMVSINMRLDAETIDLVADEFGFKTEYLSADIADAADVDEEEDDEEDLITRPPIVTVMGHVDHGKTSLLDKLRNSNVIEGEAGGITQHIGAYSLKLENGKRITFLDTPGHEAFTAMRARGAKVTDVAIIIVAADDDVMPQTKEAINHASAAGVPIVFAINKIDKPHANPDRIKEQLAAMNYLVEDWGGKYQCQEISAKQGLNLDLLLEKVLLEAELLDLKANPKRKASGSVIESSLDKGRGYVATVLVSNGTLRMGDVVLSGTNFGKVKAMFNERNQRIEEAGPSTPVLILGLDGAPTAGENFVVMESEQEARSIANKREQLKREQDNRTRKGLTLEELARRKALGNFQELNVIIKGDVDGSIEALSDSLIKLSTEEIQVNVLHKGVGQISESDVVLASASNAIIIGFQVRPSQAARKLADQDGVEIRTYSIIYDTIEDIKSAMEGMLSPEIKEQITANLEVLQTFKVSKVGTIAGCIVLEGKIKRTNKIRLIRDGIVKYQGELGSLKRYKDDAKEVVMGQECGLNIEGYNDILVGDIIESFEEIEIKKTLD